MPVFLWAGKNKKGDIQKGEMEASTEEAVLANLKRMKIEPTKVKKKPKDLFENVAFLQPKVKDRDIILFARQFSTMIFIKFHDFIMKYFNLLLINPHFITLILS